MKECKSMKRSNKGYKLAIVALGMTVCLGMIVSGAISKTNTSVAKKTPQKFTYEGCKNDCNEAEDLKKISERKNDIQNILDDRWSVAMGKENMPNYGDGETDLIVKFENNRAEIKASEEDFLLKNYGKKIKVNGQNIDTKGKPTAVFILSSTCPSCQKNTKRFYSEVVKGVCRNKELTATETKLIKEGKAQMLPDDVYMMTVNNNTKKNMKAKQSTMQEYNYEFFVREGKDKNKGKELENLGLVQCDYKISIYPQGKENKITNRVPAVMFFTSKGELYDIGGNVTPERIAEILGDAPDFSKSTK